MFDHQSAHTVQCSIICTEILCKAWSTWSAFIEDVCVFIVLLYSPLSSLSVHQSFGKCISTVTWKVKATVCMDRWRWGLCTAKDKGDLPEQLCDWCSVEIEFGHWHSSGYQHRPIVSSWVDLGGWTNLQMSTRGVTMLLLHFWGNQINIPWSTALIIKIILCILSFDHQVPLYATTFKCI